MAIAVNTSWLNFWSVKLRLDVYVAVKGARGRNERLHNKGRWGPPLHSSHTYINIVNSVASSKLSFAMAMYFCTSSADALSGTSCRCGGFKWDNAYWEYMQRGRMRLLHTTDPRTLDALAILKSALFPSFVILGANVCTTLEEPSSDLTWAWFFLATTFLYKSAVARDGWSSPVNWSSYASAKHV